MKDSKDQRLLVVQVTHGLPHRRPAGRSGAAKTSTLERQRIGAAIVARLKLGPATIDELTTIGTREQTSFELVGLVDSGLVEWDGRTYRYAGMDRKLPLVAGADRTTRK